jgi:glycosyltransferase involved in cell wall biosynthesis
MTIHEAMCFSLPVIATDRVGSAEDLVIPNGNGFIYRYDDVARLSYCIDELAGDEDKKKRFGNKSLEIVRTNWGPEKAGNDLVEAMDFIYSGQLSN